MHNYKNRGKLQKSNNISRPKNISDLFHQIESKNNFFSLQENRDQIVNMLGEIPGASESLSPSILQEVCSYAMTHREEITQAIEQNGVFERIRDVDKEGNKDLESRRFVITRDDVNGELYFVITPKSKRADGTKYAHETDEDSRIEYNHGAFSETKLAYDILGDNPEHTIQPFVEIVPRKDHLNDRKPSHTPPLSQEINQKLAQAGDAVTRTLNVQISRDEKKHIVKFAPYRPRTFLDILYDKGITKEEKIGYFNKLVASVDKLHSQGLAHLDIKPDNVFIDYMGNVSLGDLDTVTKIGATIKASNPVGTNIYMSPELMLDNLLRLSKVNNDLPVGEIFAHLQDELSTGYGYVKAFDNFNENSSVSPLMVSAEQDNWSLGIMLREIILSNENVVRMDMVDLKEQNIAIDKVGSKYQDLLVLSDQLLQKPANAKPLSEINKEINMYLQKNLVADNNTKSTNEVTNKNLSISDFIKDKTLANWNQIVLEIKKIPLEAEYRAIINKILENNDPSSVAKNALDKINDTVKPNQKIKVTLSDAENNLVSVLQIIRNSAEYVLPKKDGSFRPWNLSHSAGRAKESNGLQKEQIRQSIHEYEVRIQSSLRQSNTSFRKNAQKR